MKNIRHTGIVVADIEESIAFYQGLLGLRVERDMLEKSAYIDKVLGLRDVSIRTIKLSAEDGSLVELLCYKTPVAKKTKARQLNDIGFTHIAFTVKDLGKEYLRLIGRGVTFISEPQESPNGYAKVVFCRDPEGNFIELVEVLESK